MPLAWLYLRRIHASVILACWHGEARVMGKNAKSAEQKAGAAHPEVGTSADERNPKKPDKGPDVLVARLRHGDRSAAAELVDRYHERIHLLMRRLGHARQFSEDLTQETFLRAWHHIGQLRNGQALQAWLYRIASNVSKLHWRRHKGKDLAIMKTIATANGNWAVHDQPGHREELVRLQHAVQRLPWKLRQAIVLHYMQHLSIAEAAKAAGCK